MSRKIYAFVLFLCMISIKTFAQTVVAIPPQSTTYAGWVRGYFFTAPTDFTICGIYVPTDASNGPQNVEIVRFTAGAPPAYPATTNSFVNLFYQANYIPNTMISCNIPVATGDIIGVYGYRGTGTGTINSYGLGNATVTTINGFPTTLYRSGMQDYLAVTPMHDIWTEAANINPYIGRVEIYYGCCNGPTGGAINGNATVCPGSTQTYQVNGVDSATSFTWTVPPGATIVSGQGDSIITVTMGTTSGQVCVTPGNPCTNAAQICFTVNVNPPITGGVILGDSSVCSGITQTYTLSNIQNATNFTWTVPAGCTIISGQGDTSITVLMNGTSGNICVTPSTPCNVGTTICIPVTIVPSPNITSTSFSNASCPGNDGTITLNGLLPNTTYLLSYTDSAGGLHVQNVTTNASGTYIITGLTAGVYSNVYVKLFYCTSAAVGPFTITAPVVPGTPVTSDLSYCQYETAGPLTATTSPGDTLVWYTQLVGGVGTLAPPVPNTAVVGTTTWYVAQKSLSNGCESYRAVLHVVVIPKPTVPVVPTSSYAYCQYDSGALQLYAVGDSMKWYTTPTGGSYTMVAPTPATDVLGVFTWYVSQTVNGCESDRVPVTVGIYQKPEPPVTKDIIFCQGDVASPLTAIGTDLKWYLLPYGGSPQPTPTPITTIPDTAYWYVASNNHGCESDRTPLKVITKYRPTVHILYSNDSVCQFDNLTYQYSGNAYNTATWAWEWPVGAHVVSGNDSTPGPIVVRFDSTGSKIVALTVSDDGCSGPRVTVPVEVKVLPTARIDISSRNACKDDTIKVGISDANMGMSQFWWDFDGGITPFGSSGIFGADGGGPFHIYWTTMGIHPIHLHLQGVNQCYSQPDAVDTVNLHDRPEAKIQSISANNICSGDSIRLSASTNFGGYNYQWAPKEFFDMGDNTPVVNAYVEFSHQVILRVTDPFGCENEDSVMINTKPCCEIFLPDAFSPNGDGKNDLFRVVDMGRHPFTDFKVLNRWGEVIFNTTDPSQGWDGSHEGVAQDIGVYYYIVKYKCDGKSQTKSGQVTLVR